MSGGFNAPTGSSTTLGLGLELAPSQPREGTATERLFIPSLDLPRAESSNASAELSQLPGPTRKVPGSLGGDGVTMNLRFAPGLMLLPLAHLMGRITSKTEVETGVFQYVLPAQITALYAHVCTFWAVLDAAPLDIRRVFNVALNGLALNIGNNSEIQVALSGGRGLESRFGPAVHETAVGTYAYAPILAGQALDPYTDVWVQISDTSGGEIRFRVEQTDGVPAWIGPEHRVVLDADSQASRYVDVVGADGRDLGVVERSNRDPLMVAFPGRANDLAGLQVGDTWRFPGAGKWTLADLAMPTVDGEHNRLVSSHWRIQARAAGSTGPYAEVSADTGTLNLAAPFEAVMQNGSRYASRWVRNEPSMFTTQLTRGYLSNFFREADERGTLLDVLQTFEGRQLGTGAFRESIAFHTPEAEIFDYATPVVQGEQKESFTLKGTTEDRGTPGVTVTITTDRDLDITELGYI